MKNWTDLLFSKEDLSWIEPPSVESLKEINISIKNKNVSSLLKDYKRIAARNFQDRITALSYIQEELSGVDFDPLDIKLKKICSDKSNYLKHIIYLQENNIIYNDTNLDIYNKELLQDFFVNNEDITLDGKQYTPRNLSNEVLYSFEQSRFWGENWLEVVDPAHRMLDHQRHIWQRLVKSGEVQDNFFVFLETMHISPKERSKIIYTNNDLVQKKIKIKDGLLCTYADSKNDYLPITTPPICGDYNNQDFIFDLKGDLYSSVSSPLTGHTSISQGRPVLGGGVFTAEDGLLTQIKGNSGHYLFYDQHMKQTIDLFKRSGAIMSEHLTIKSFEDFHTRKKYSLRDFENKPI